MREKNHLLLSSFNIRKTCLQSCTGAYSYQYTSTHLRKATTFSRSPTSIGRELQPPSSCTSRSIYQYVGADLHKSPTFTCFPAATQRELQPPGSCTSQSIYQYVGASLQNSYLHTFSSCYWKGDPTPWLLYWPICLPVRRHWPTEGYDLLSSFRDHVS